MFAFLFRDFSREELTRGLFVFADLTILQKGKSHAGKSDQKSFADKERGKEGRKQRNREEVMKSSGI